MYSFVAHRWFTYFDLCSLCYQRSAFINSNDNYQKSYQTYAFNSRYNSKLKTLTAAHLSRVHFAVGMINAHFMQTYEQFGFPIIFSTHIWLIVHCTKMAEWKFQASDFELDQMKQFFNV